jgi:hypothetical protein
LAYTSDLRIKNIIKDIHLQVVNDLNKIGIKENIYLRIFDESSEDSKSWDDGGLTFMDPEVGKDLGSNDAAWYYKRNGIDIPLVVVEGTFGVERGQFGDGQLNRFSHPLGPAKNGYIGVLFSPSYGESFVKVEEHRFKPFDFKFSMAYLHKDIVRAALNVNKIETGKYFTIDAYNGKLLKELVKNKFLDVLGKKNNYVQTIQEIETIMFNYVNATKRSSNSQLLKQVFDNENQLQNDYVGRIFTHNIAALTTAQKRDAHGLLGKSLVESYLIGNKKLLSIFIRLTKEDIKFLKGRKSKEFTYLCNSSRFKIVCFDDLLFDDNKEKTKLVELRADNLHESPKKKFIKDLKQSFESGKIKIKFQNP